MLRDTVRDLLTKTYDIETLRAVTDTEQGWDPKGGRRSPEIGILGLTIEEDGGMGAGPVELSAVLGEIGRTLAPEPYLNGVVVPAALISDTADGPVRAELLGGLASGELRLPSPTPRPATAGRMPPSPRRHRATVRSHAHPAPRPRFSPVTAPTNSSSPRVTGPATPGSIVSSTPTRRACRAPVPDPSTAGAARKSPSTVPRPCG